MGLIDNLTKTISQGVDRGKYELEKFQKTSRIQGELNDLKKQIDENLRAMGQRAYELHRAGQLNSPSITALIQALEQLQAGIVLKEEELKAAQVDTFVQPPSPSSYPSTAQQVPISHEPSVTVPPVTTPAPTIAADKKVCPNCGFAMPITAMFCPSCGTRVGAL